MNKRWQIYEPGANAWTDAMDTNDVARQVIAGKFDLQQQARNASTWATTKVGSISLLEAAIESLRRGGTGIEVPAGPPERIDTQVRDPKEDRSPKRPPTVASPNPAEPRTVSPEEAQFYADLDRLEAKRIRERDAGENKNTTPGSLLTSWASIALWPTEDRKTKEIRECVLASLKEKAIDEVWSFPTEDDKFSILRSYLRITFYRLFRQKKIAFSGNRACFNTGLLDSFYQPIYAVFKKNTNEGSRPFRFEGFCITGEDKLGKWFMRKFPRQERPPAASYLSEFKHVVVKPHVEITFQWSHIIHDGVRRGRFPLAFLLRNAPRQMREPALEQSIHPWLAEYANVLMSDRNALGEFGRVVQMKTNNALQRVGWNYKTAIPNYFATANSMSILLPLSLLDQPMPDVALVIGPVDDGEKEWYASTVYTLDMAYNNARVVSKPMSDWLLVDKIVPGPFSEGSIEPESE